MEALISDVQNLNVEIQQLQENLEAAKEKYTNSKSDQQQVERQLADISAKIREAQSAIDPLRVSDEI